MMNDTQSLHCGGHEGAPPPHILKPAVPELLAPAGDFERLEAAVLYGADAVYLAGKRFGLRAAPANFDQDGLARAVNHCHSRGVRVYVTCNTLPTNEEADQLPAFIRHAHAVGVDALIVADVGVLMLAKRVAPGLEVHISTQAGVVNYLTATELYHMGASRVILARELALEDIATIRDKSPAELEIEVFVHGAMCISFSGRCLLSQYLTHRDSNRGQCSQPCRWGYHLMEEKRDGLYFPVYEDQQGTYILNAQDLCLLPHLDKLAKAGVTSFKIEGRAKSVYYVAAITHAYRAAIDLYLEHPDGYQPPHWMMEEAGKVSHRQYSTGFLFPDQPAGQYYACRGYVRDWEVVATVDGYRDGHILCSERNRFGVGEELEILRPDGRPLPMQVERIINGEGEEVPVARHPMEPLKLPFPQEIPAGSMLRRKAREPEEK